MITKVERVGICHEKHFTYKGRVTVCNTPVVRVTFDNGREIICHDDGSFIAYTGEQG